VAFCFIAFVRWRCGKCGAGGLFASLASPGIFTKYFVSGVEMNVFVLVLILLVLKASYGGGGGGGDGGGGGGGDCYETTTKNIFCMQI
jgi:hypothetical protein